MKRRLTETVSTQGSAIQLAEACAHVRELVARDQIEKALTHLQQIAASRDSHLVNEIIDLLRQFRSAERNELAGAWTREAAEAEKSRITKFLLQLTDELDYQRKARRAAVELSPAEVRARTSYLQIVRKDVQNRLDVSIHRARFIDLGIGDTPSATHLPWIYKDPDSLREFTNFDDAFIEYNRRLLLLGAPGSGKTVTLLNVALRLVAEAEDNPAAPVPLLVNLSKFQLRPPASVFNLWRGKEPDAEKRDDRVERWLLSELTDYPVVSTEIARKWLAEGRIAALLDGLDEVNDEYRAELVRVLNATYLRDHPEATVVVCSRINEYRPLQDRKETSIQFEGAVTLQPLNKTQIDDYLKEAKAIGLSQALLGDETLAQMAQTPLTLSMMTLAYGGVAPADIPSYSSLTEQRHHLMDAYVQKMLQRKERRDRPGHGDDEVPEEEYAYKPEKVKSYLGWLAVRLSVRMQTAFSTHRLFSFLIREIDRDRQSGVWWATVFCRTPVIVLLTVLAGVAIAPMTSQAWLHTLYAGLVGAAVYVPVAWAFHTHNEMHHWLQGAKSTLGSIIGTVAVIGGLGVASITVSSVLPFGIPPVPAGIITICSVAVVVFMAKIYNSDDEALSYVMVGSALAAFLVGLLAMRSSFGLEYGWYIPAAAMTAGLVIPGGIYFAYDEDDWRFGGVVLLFALVVAGILAGGVFLVGHLDWYKSLITIVGIAVIILGIAQKPALILVSFLASFVIGGAVGRIFFPPGESVGSVFGALICGSLSLLYLIYFDPGYTVLQQRRTRIGSIIQYSMEKVEKLADQYLLSPVLLRVVGITRCFPLRFMSFFEYVERALLLKRSAGDIEFMHRLLRDYFALRDLQPLLKATDSNRRLEAIRSLGFQGDAAIDALAEFVRSRNPDVREAAAWAFGKMASPEVVQHLEAAIRDPEARVRRAAVISAKNLPEKESTRLISLVMDDQEASVQQAWIETTLTLPNRYGLYSYRITFEGAEFMQRMLNAIKDRDDLRQILFELLETHSDNQLRRLAIEIIKPLHDSRSVPALIAALSDRSFTDRSEAAFVLGTLGDPRAVKPLSKLLSVRNKSLRNAVQVALHQIGAPDTMAALKKRR